MFLSVVLFLSFLYSSLSVSSDGSSDVQYAHLVAAIGISDMQYGQIFVAGAAGASSSFLSSFSVLEARLFITFTKQKITSAIRRKLITAVIKLPYLIVSFSPDPDHPVGKIDPTSQKTDHRHDHIIYKRIHNRLECTTNNNADCKIHYISPCNKLFEFCNKSFFSHLKSTSFVPFRLLRHIRILYYIPNRISTIIPHTTLIP